MAMAANDIERLIRARIPDAKVTIQDLAGDGDHYKATVIAESFRGKSRVQQHQIVYEALKAEMGGKLHALALQTGTPDGALAQRTSPGPRSRTAAWYPLAISAMAAMRAMGFAGVLRYIYCTVTGEIRRGCKPAASKDDREG